MPTISVFIRKEDVSKWKALSNKSEFLHNALSGVVLHKKSEAYKKASPNEVTLTTPFAPRPPDPEMGYPCCTKARPCKHWQWDGNRSVYVNSLTNKEREADII